MRQHPGLLQRAVCRLTVLLAPLPLAAHMVSMSTGELRIAGERAEYELRMPLYEVAHVRDPERSLFEQIHFRSGGAEARIERKSCRADQSAGSYLCTAVYVFAGPVEKLEVESRLPSVTVSNHVHLLRAHLGDKTDQAVLDFSFPSATLRFRPPTEMETATTQFGAGMARAAGGAAQLLFLLSLALAARRRRELLALAGTFLLGQITACVLSPALRWQPNPRFVEAAAALTIAYLAVEMLLLPEAGKRWLVVGVLGVFHGLYFEMFLRESGYRAVYVLAGVAVAEIVLIALFGLGLGWIKKLAGAVRPVRVGASLLLAIGLAWFLLRLRG